MSSVTKRHEHRRPSFPLRRADDYLSSLHAVTHASLSVHKGREDDIANNDSYRRPRHIWPKKKTKNKKEINMKITKLAGISFRSRQNHDDVSLHRKPTRYCQRNVPVSNILVEAALFPFDPLFLNGDLERRANRSNGFIA